jgi:hypothetical protein
MSDSRTSSLPSFPSALSLLAVGFEAGQLTSDGGLVWLAQADDRRICYRLAHVLLFCGLILGSRSHVFPSCPSRLTFSCDPETIWGNRSSRICLQMRAAP